MRIHFRNLIFFKSVFARLMSSFFLIILIVASFNVVSYKFYINNIEKEMVNNADERLANISSKFDNYLDDILNLFLRIYEEDDFKTVLTEQPLSEVDRMKILTLLSNYIKYTTDIEDIIVVSNKTDFIISPMATYEKQRYFSRYSKSTDYNEEFWINEMKKSFNFKIYKASEFIDYSYEKAVPEILMPIAFKNKSNSNYILIALVKVDELVKSYDESFANKFIIWDNNNEELLYTKTYNNNIIKDILENDKGFGKTDGGYLLTRESDKNNIRYTKFLSNTEIKNQVLKTSYFFVIIIIISVIISLTISTYTSSKFNRVIRKIIDTFNKPQLLIPKNNSTTDLQYIRNNIQKIVVQNSDITKELSEKNSILEMLFYQTSIKDIYKKVNGLIDHHFKGNYILVCFKIHYKDSYFQKICRETNEDTFYIKELLELYLKEHFTNTVIFQSENDEIVSIIEIGKNVEYITTCIRDILIKLKPEEEYIFFTAAISRTNKDFSEITTVYNKTNELYKYRMINDETQIVTEDSINTKNNKFIFTLEQTERLSNLLKNGNKVECLKEIDKILEKNLKSNVNNFYFTLLCSELINCGVRVLTRLYGDIPDSLNVSEFYKQINKAFTLVQYSEICKDFFALVTEYINENKMEKDYIIDYLKEYVENHYSEDIYLDLLAEKLNITKVYISSYFKNRIGINLSDYINKYRINKSLELLENSNEKVQDIAQKVGIKNSTTFIRTFKRYIGKTPNEYRKSRM